MSERWLTHPLLTQRGVQHGFGLRDAPPPRGLVRPRQVHGAHVAVLAKGAVPELDAVEADAIVSSAPGVPVGVATADCVPVLLAVPSGEVVSAIHAGWRGLARGVIPAAVEVLERSAEGATPRDRLAAVVGPHIGPCCYEVDAPVLDRLGERFGAALAPMLRTGRAGHAWLDLGALTREALLEAGLAPERVAVLAGVCTRCDARRFHSYRRDGPRAGRLLHHVAARATDEP